MVVKLSSVFNFLAYGLSSCLSCVFVELIVLSRKWREKAEKQPKNYEYF